MVASINANGRPRYKTLLIFIFPPKVNKQTREINSRYNDYMITGCSAEGCHAEAEGAFPASNIARQFADGI